MREITPTSRATWRVSGMSATTARFWSARQLPRLARHEQHHHRTLRHPGRPCLSAPTNIKKET